MTLITALPYDFGTATTPDRNFFQQLQANFDVAEVAFNGIVPQLAKAWASVTVALTVPTVQDGYNIASVAFSATGIYTITLTTPFSSVNWVPLGSGGDANVYTRFGSTTVNSTDILFTNDAGTKIDPPSFYFVGLGNQ